MDRTRSDLYGGIISKTHKVHCLLVCEHVFTNYSTRVVGRTVARWWALFRIGGDLEFAPKGLFLANAGGRK